MKWSRAPLALLSVMLISSTSLAAMQRASVGDAYARKISSGEKWVIGTKSVQESLEFKDGKLLLTGFANKTLEGGKEYASHTKPSDLLEGSGRQSVEKYKVEKVWEKALLRGEKSVDPALDGVKISVKKGDMIGFAIGVHGDYASCQTEWITTVDYGDGDKYVSTDDRKVNQGPIWYYYTNVPNTGFLDEMQSVEWSANMKEDLRIPTEESGNRAPGMAPHVGSTVMHPSNELDGVRAWRAPKDGVVTVSGPAKSVGGNDVVLKVLHITPLSGISAKQLSGNWELVSSDAKESVEGGRPTVELEIGMKMDDLRMEYHVMAYPHTSIVRQWSVVTNDGKGSIALRAFDKVFSLGMDDADAKSFTNYWMNNLGTSSKDQWKMLSSAVTDSYHKVVGTTATIQYIPWMGLVRNSGDSDGLFVDVDYMGTWSLGFDHETNGPTQFSVRTSFSGLLLNAGESFKTPYVTVGVFKDSLDEMQKNLYDWQYTYLWDYTHDDWFAKMQFTAAWWLPGHNLQEQFTGRIAELDMDWSEYLRTAGMDVVWEDAGWAANPDIWVGNREGPDHAHTLRYLPKMGMQWCLWFPGDPTSGIMDTKVGSWGNFQWRTDGLPLSNGFDGPFRSEVSGFLKKHPRSSWQTCSGGGTYAHTFEWQRYGDVHYDTDPPGNAVTNFYTSYLDLPDKWFDNLATWTADRDDPYVVRRMLSECPKWGDYITESQLKMMTGIADMYHYLVKEGVAGRWSLMPHPVVKGDDEFYYCQRLSYDRTKSIIIPKHKAPGDVLIYPRGLVADHTYLVQWDSAKPEESRTGTDLMERGILLHDQTPGEYIYLNLPNRPMGRADHTAPKSPTSVLSRREMNVGFTGVGIYWSPGSDNNWISAYEVKRGDKFLGRVGTGTYFFDRSADWDTKAAYSVRTVDGDGNTSPWVTAKPIHDEQLVYSVLGGHFPETGRNGWSAETTVDGTTFTPMQWIPPLRPPSADFGGTSDQPGGGEGYWEGASTARVGRGWMQASKDAMCVRTWTAPQSGKVRIAGRTVKEYYHNAAGNALKVKILQGKDKVWPVDSEWASASVNDLNGPSHLLTVDVQKGDTVRFVLDRGSSPDNDLLCWMPMISYVEGASASEEPQVVRVLCGSNKEYVDSTGNKWSADRFYAGGKSTSSQTEVSDALPSSKDQSLYLNGRAGKSFGYSIPVKPGIYCIRLKFAEPKFKYFFERPMNLDINGRRVMSNVDICHAARGSNRAYERLFRYVVPNGDGKIVMQFTGGWEPRMQSSEAIVKAIEVLPEVKPSVRIACGRDKEFVDWASYIWSPDSGFAGGTAIHSDAVVSQASPTLYDQDLYRNARTGKTIDYAFDLPQGLYVVHLKFAELWMKEIGQRPMDIAINGMTFWSGWDPSRCAGKLGMTADLRAEYIVPGADGKIHIKVSAAGANDAILQGIEIE